MDPNTLAEELRRIASRIDRSEKPSREGITRQIVSLHRRLANGADQKIVQFMAGFESKEALIHELILAMVASTQLYLKEEGYSSEEKLKSDDSEHAKEVKGIYELLKKQGDVVENALRAIQPEVAALDREMYELLI